MDILSHLMMGLHVAAQPYNLLTAVVGLILGVIVGVLPGLGGANGCAILIPVTFVMPPVAAVILLVAMIAAMSRRLHASSMSWRAKTRLRISRTSAAAAASLPILTLLRPSSTNSDGVALPAIPASRHFPFFSGRSEADSLPGRFFGVTKTVASSRSMAAATEVASSA